VLGLGRQQQGLDPQGGEDVAVGRIAGAARATRSPASKAERKARRKPAEEPVVTMIRSIAGSQPYQSL
jgi:hypothetical protein